MSRIRKDKLEKYTDASLQLVAANPTEESIVSAADNYIKVSMEKRKKEANEPLYLKRI